MKTINVNPRGVAQFILLACLTSMLFGCNKYHDTDKEFIKDWKKTYDTQYFDLDKRLQMIKEKHPIAFALQKSIRVTVNSEKVSADDAYIVIGLVAKYKDIHPNKFKILLDNSREIDPVVFINPPSGKMAFGATLVSMVPVHELKGVKEIFIKLNDKMDMLFNENDINKFMKGYQKRLQAGELSKIDFSATVKP